MTVARLAEISVVLTKHAPDLGQWFAVALQRIREGEEPAEALDLSGYRAERAPRRCLFHAAEILDPDMTLATDAISKRLALEIKRFETRVLPRARKCDPGEFNPLNLSPLDQLLWEAITTWKNMPRSARRLFDFLTVNGWHRQIKPADTQLSSENQNL